MSYDLTHLTRQKDNKLLAEKVKEQFGKTQEGLTAGNALEVLSDRGDTDKVPYVFRKTGGAKKAYNREMLKKIVGGTVAWNQHVPLGTDKSKTQNGVTFVDNRDGSYTVSTDANGATADTYISVSSGSTGLHKRLITGCPQGGSTATYFLLDAWNSGNYDTGNGKIYSPTSENFDVRINVKTGAVITTPIIFRPQVFDLTQMFGSTIADAIYAMEQATAGSGVAFFRSLFPNDYYAYDAGSLQSVQAKEHRLTGFNQWDEVTESGYINLDTGENQASSYTIRAKNYIHVFPNTTYYKKSPIPFWNYYYDENKNFIGYGNSSINTTFTTPANCHYMRFAFETSYGTTYMHDTCINISKPTGTPKNGDYVPYDGHTYPLDSTFTLRGIPKLDSDGNLYYDGDEYTPDGSVKRKYGIVELGTFTWSYITNDGDPYFACWPNSKRIGSLNMVCTKYLTHTATGTGTLPDKYIGASGSSNGVFIRDSSYNDSSQFKAAMYGVYLVYELATPDNSETADPYHEIQICNRYGTEEFVDAGVTASTPTRDVSIPVGTDTFYPVNVFDYIEELTNPDHDMIADSNIQSGKYFMVGNSLYLSTEAIEQGAAIVPGTNCTAISLAEALNLINQ